MKKRINKTLLCCVIIIFIIFASCIDGVVWEKDNFKSISKLKRHDKIVIKEEILKEEWNEGTTECIFDYVIMVNGRKYYYHTECGTFIDELTNRPIDKINRAEINSILKEYFDN